LLVEPLLVLDVLGDLLANVSRDSGVTVLAHGLRIPVDVLHAGGGDVHLAPNAGEVLLAPLPVDGGDHTAGRRATAASAARPRDLIVVRLAVGLALVLIEGAASERLLALGADEVLAGGGGGEWGGKVPNQEAKKAGK